MLANHWVPAYRSSSKKRPCTVLIHLHVNDFNRQFKSCCCNHFCFWIIWLQNKQNTAVHPLKHNYEFWPQWFEGNAGSFTGDTTLCLWNAGTLFIKVCKTLIKLKLYISIITVMNTQVKGKWLLYIHNHELKEKLFSIFLSAYTNVH